MAMDLGSKGSLHSDINVTPLVDVMLVLLIIVMLVAPVIQHDGGITLPDARNSGEKPDTQQQTVVAIDSRSTIYVNALPVSAEQLVPRVKQALDRSNDKLVYLKGDKAARYSTIMAAMDALRSARIDDIALITERRKSPGGAPARPR